MENFVTLVVVLFGMALFASIIGTALITLFGIPNKYGRPAKKLRARRSRSC